MDPVFAAALRVALVATVNDTPRVRRRWRWRFGTGLFLGLTVVVGGAALASGVLTLPGGSVNTSLGVAVTASRSGTATIDLGTPPATATDISIALTCLTPDTFTFPGGSYQCDESDMSRSAAFRTVSDVVPLTEGVNSVTVTTGASASWTLRASYVNQVTTSLGVDASGETYGVVNQKGTPDLVAVVIDDGKLDGYVKATDLNCAAGGGVESLSEAANWDKVSQDMNVTIPVYQSDGVTEIGTFFVGHATEPSARTVPLSSLSLGCK
jgi:hypothetical protein